MPSLPTSVAHLAEEERFRCGTVPDAASRVSGITPPPSSPRAPMVAAVYRQRGGSHAQAIQGGSHVHTGSAPWPKASPGVPAERNRHGPARDGVRGPERQHRPHRCGLRPGHLHPRRWAARDRAVPGLNPTCQIDFTFNVVGGRHIRRGAAHRRARPDSPDRERRRHAAGGPPRLRPPRAVVACPDGGSTEESTACRPAGPGGEGTGRPATGGPATPAVHHGGRGGRRAGAGRRRGPGHRRW